jgi:hypothetical protein
MMMMMMMMISNRRTLIVMMKSDGQKTNAEPAFQKRTTKLTQAWLSFLHYTAGAIDEDASGRGVV